jgi:hypothetical protein
MEAASSKALLLEVVKASACECLMYLRVVRTGTPLIRVWSIGSATKASGRPVRSSAAFGPRDTLTGSEDSGSV